MARFPSTGLLLVLLFAILSICQAASIESFMGDPAMVEEEINCVLGRGPCDRLGRSLKAALDEVLGNDCGRCTPQQLVNALKMIEYMEKYHQPEWEEIVLNYQQSSE